jgi:hypothetical protein
MKSVLPWVEAKTVNRLRFTRLHIKQPHFTLTTTQ